MTRRTSTNQNQNFNLHLEELGRNVSEAAKKALADGADVIVADAKRRIHNVSGKLSESIVAKPNKDGTKFTISANAKNEKGKMYGRLVEFWPGREHPFMYPAMDANRSKIIENIIEAIGQAVNDLAVSR